MNRPRTKDKHLPKNVYHRHGAYYFVKAGKWKPLGVDLATALSEYARIIQPSSGGCDELLERTLDRCREKLDKGELSQATVDQYAIACKQLKLNLTEFTPTDLKPKHIAALLDHDRNTPSMANRKLTFLRIAFQNGLTWGICETNPAYGVKRLPEHKRDRLIGDAEFLKVQEHAPKHIRIVMDLAFSTGQRIMDVVWIALADVSEQGIYFKQRKTGKKLLVRMTPDIQSAVDKAKALHTNIRGLTLFHQRNGKRYSYGAIRDAFRRACAKAGVQDYRPNDHRAMSLTAARRGGLNATKLAGHSTEATTLRYLRDRSPEVVDGPSFGQELENWTPGSKKSKA